MTCFMTPNSNLFCPDTLAKNDYCVACHVAFSCHVMLLSLASHVMLLSPHDKERWGAGVETQKNVRGEIGGWGRVPFNEPYAPSLSTIYDGA